MITLESNTPEIIAAFDRLASAAGKPRAALKGTGESLVQSTKQRFKDSKGPDGEVWQINTEATFEAFLSRFSRIKKGYVKKPLIGETKSLSTAIYYDIIGEAALAIGSPMEYAAMMQFGGKKEDYPHLWGDIPARPFLGLSKADERDILDDLADYFTGNLTGSAKA